MKKLALISAAMGGMLLAQQAVSATIIPNNLEVDFRAPSWAAANYQPNYTVNYGPAYMVTATALPVPKTIWQDKVDGLGVRGGTNSDEIDREEILDIFFNVGNKKFSGIWLTDLFDAPDGGANGEDGWVVLTLTDTSQMTINFNGTASHQANGELYINFGKAVDVRNARFYALQTRYDQGNDYSVAGFTVPEPFTVALLGLGLAGIGFSMRKRG